MPKIFLGAPGQGEELIPWTQRHNSSQTHFLTEFKPFVIKKNLKLEKAKRFSPNLLFFFKPPNLTGSRSCLEGCRENRRWGVGKEFFGFGFFFPTFLRRRRGKKNKTKKPKQQYFWTSLALYSLRKLFPTYTTFPFLWLIPPGFHRAGFEHPQGNPARPKSSGMSPGHSPGCR